MRRQLPARTPHARCVSGLSHGHAQAQARAVSIQAHAFSPLQVSYRYIDLWSRRSTWGGGDPPVEGDLAVVPAGADPHLPAQGLAPGHAGAQPAALRDQR